MSDTSRTLTGMENHNRQSKSGNINTECQKPSDSKTNTFLFILVLDIFPLSLIRNIYSLVHFVINGSESCIETDFKEECSGKDGSDIG